MQNSYVNISFVTDRSNRTCHWGCSSSLPEAHVWGSADVALELWSAVL
jgi:hypothetical protein